MKKILNNLVKTIVAFCLIIGTFLTNSKVYAENNELTAQQKNAIAMLNYITVLTQEINASKNSQLYMEQAYSSLINNTYPNAVDSRTLNQMNGLLDTMEQYRMIDVKRERLQYVYEQTQAQAIRSAIPNPIGLLGTVRSMNPVTIVASVVYMAVDSATSYAAYKNQAEQQFLKDGWALDDEAAKVLHESRSDTFTYMVKMVNEYNLPGDLTLTEDTVKEFVECKNNSSVASRIRFLESNQNTYQFYGGYWLTLAESYYENENYKKCLDAINTYENMGVRIFRNDYELARILPLAIASARKTYSPEKYAQYASEKAQKIINNTEHDDWALRYFASQTYADLYANTKNQSYLKKAYDVTLDSVNYLIPEQQALNTAYLAKVHEEDIPKDATKDEKDEIKKYNKMLKDVRNTELPPVYEPLLLNCNMLFAIADEMKISKSDKTTIDNILHPKGVRLFLTETIDDQFWFNNTAHSSDQSNVRLDGKTITLPATILTNDAEIAVTITESDSSKVTDITDFKLDKVSRKKEGDISTFAATFKSAQMSKYKWTPFSVITIKVIPTDGSKTTTEYEFVTNSNKDDWYDNLKVWEKNITYTRTK